MTTIWLIRHGESEANAGLPTGATAGIGLTPLGQAQAAAVAASFTRPPDLIVSSHYRRTIESAAPTRARFPQAPYAQWPIHEVATLSDASRHNTTPAQRAPLIRAYWERADPHYVDGPGAESFVQLVARARDVLDRMRRLDTGFVVLFGHGLFTRALLWVYLAAPATLDTDSMRAYRGFVSSFRVPNASVLEVYRSSAHALLFGTFSVAHLPPALRSSEQPAAPRPQED